MNVRRAHTALSSTVPSISAMTDCGPAGRGDEVSDETEPGDKVSDEGRESEPGGTATGEASDTEPGDEVSDEARDHPEPSGTATDPVPEAEPDVAVPVQVPEAEPTDTATDPVPETEPGDTATEASESAAGDAATFELEKVRAAAAELNAKLKDPNRPKKDHYGRFDPIYRILRAIRRSRIGKKMPDVIMKPISYLMHVIAIHDGYNKMLTGQNPFADPFIVPISEHVTVPAFFVIELFTPSVAGNLSKAMRKNKWNSGLIKAYPEPSSELVEEARSGTRTGWWLMGSIARRGASGFYPDASRQKLPATFDAVEFKGVQVGEGVTALIARFDLSDQGARRLDTVWHSLYQPGIDWGRWGGPWPQAQGAKWVAFRETQLARGALHHEARLWLRKFCPGVFASNEQPQPLIDVLLFDELDGAFAAPPSEQVSDNLRALGLSSGPTIEKSKQLPGMILTPAEVGCDSKMEHRATWSLWGRRSTLVDKLSELRRGLGLDGSDGAIVHCIDRAIQSYFILLSISQLLRVSQVRYSVLRDTARDMRGVYHMKHLEALRSSLLTLSLDLSSIDRDVRSYNQHGWRHDPAQFRLEYVPWLAERDVKQGFGILCINQNKDLRTQQIKMLKTLATADGDYRQILTSAASLTSSMQTLRSGRVAVWVSLASLVVAATALLLSSPPEHSQLDNAVGWLQAACHWVAALLF